LGLEMVMHLESLCFLIFLINSASPQDWFRSWYFKTWATGSLISVTYLPLITILTRSDPLKCEASTFLAASTENLLLTVCSMIVMLRFKPFLENIRIEGIHISVLVRLTKFYELNIIYLLSRVLTAISFLLLSVDGVRSHHHINESLFLTDLLQAIAGFGVAISAAIALPIFFPRSIEGEIARADSRRGKNFSPNNGMSHFPQAWAAEVHDMYDLDGQSNVDPETDKTGITFKAASIHRPPLREGGIEYIISNVAITPPRLEPNRRHSPPATIGYRQAPSMYKVHLPAGHVISGAQSSGTSQLVKTFKSPLDIGMGRG